MRQRKFKPVLPFFTADFETNNSEQNIINRETNVWLWDICMKINNDYQHINGFSISTFFSLISHILPTSRIWFHNLKFDGNFIIHYLLSNNFIWNNKTKLKNGEFSTLISFKKIFYSIKVRLNNKTFEFVDSSKKINGSIEDIAKAWNLPILKGEIDYMLYRPLDHIATDEEIAYINNDTEIAYRVMEYEYADNLTAITTASDCLSLFKESIGGEKMYRQLYPVLSIDMDNYIRQAYRGGLCWVNKKFQGKVLYDVDVYDENSMYPDKMYRRYLPYGYPEKFEGKYIENPVYNLYIQHIKVACCLKPKGIECILLHNQIFQSEYLVSTNNEIIDLTLTSIDLKLLFDNYEIQHIEYIDGLMFKSSNAMFKKYIEPIYITKSTTKGCEKNLAKLKINGLYGKFAANPINYIIEPKLVDGIVKYDVVGSEYSEPEYTALSAFVTAYAREDILSVLVPNYDYACYCDTDSAHLLKGYDSSVIQVDDKKLGYYKLERTLSKVKYLAQKTYYGYEHMDNKMIEYKKICGASKEVKEHITFKRFVFGEEFEGKLVPKIVRGGVVLVPTTFTLKDRKKGHK